MEQEKMTAGQRPKRIAMYVIYDKDGILDNYRKYYLKELRKEVDTIIGIVSGTLTQQSRKELEELTDNFFVRENVGLLAGSWLDGIAHIGWDVLDEYDELLMLNDSFFGPFYPLREMMDAAEASDADFYGAIKNFEDESITNYAGRGFKHGHLRGSLCYFYIIKDRLLHSVEFKSYWSRQPKIESDTDTFFFSEFDFFDYVKDCGFKIDSFQTDKLKGYCHDSLSHNIRKLVEDERIPFARIRPFGTDMRDQSLLLHYGRDTRDALDYIDKETDYDAGMIWDFILRTKNLSNIWNQLQLEYVLPEKCLERAYTYDKKIGVIVHIFYSDQAEVIANYCDNFPENTDFFVTTTTEESKQAIDDAFSKRKLHYECTIRPNVGVAMSSLWVTYAEKVTSGEYEYMCYFHDKKSPYSKNAIQGEQFGVRCFENLFGSKELVKNIINLFEDNKRLGVVGPPTVYHGAYFNTPQLCWAGNYQNTLDLVNKLGLNVTLDPNIYPVTAYGDMLWFRTDALKKAIGYGLTYKDFDVVYKPDFTFMHAVERIYGYAAQDSGYYFAEVISSDNARSDLVNYRYIIDHVCDLLTRNGVHFGNYHELIDSLNGYLAPIHMSGSLSAIVSKMVTAPYGLKDALAIYVNKKIPFLFRKTAAKFPKETRSIGLKEAIKIWFLKRVIG